MLPGVLYFEITGGEPFLIKQQFDLLQFAADCGEAHHIEVHYNTNGSIFPDHAPAIWSHFKKVEIAFSIDNVGKRFEYELKHGKWTETL
jgi:organic radical activating enzyme